MTETARATTAGTAPDIRLDLSVSDDLMAAMELRPAESYDGTGIQPPEVDEVLTEALQTLAVDASERADDLASCNHVDNCVAMSLALRALARALDPR